MNRKQAYLLILLTYSPALALAQSTLSVSATIAPTLSRTAYAYRYFFPESDGQVVEPVYISGRRWSAGYSAGVSVRYEYAPGWSVSSGLWYQQLSLRQARQPSAGAGTTTLRSRVIRLPLLLHYASSAKRLSPCFSLGFAVDLPLTARVVVTRDADPTQYLRLKTLIRPVFQGMLGAGARYKLTSRYTLLAQPVWTYTFGQFGGSGINDPTFEVSLLTQVAYSF